VQRFITRVTPGQQSLSYSTDNLRQNEVNIKNTNI